MNSEFSYIVMFIFFRRVLSEENCSLLEGEKNGRSRDPINMSDLTLDAFMAKAAPQVVVQVTPIEFLLLHR